MYHCIYISIDHIANQGHGFTSVIGRHNYGTKTPTRSFLNLLSKQQFICRPSKMVELKAARKVCIQVHR